MLVFTSVMVTLTPGSVPPEPSTMFPTSDPFTACAAALPVHANTSATSVALAPSVRLNPPIAPSLQGLQLLISCPARRRQLSDPNIAEPHLVAVVLQEDVPLQLRAPAGFILELALRFCGLERRTF